MDASNVFSNFRTTIVIKASQYLGVIRYSVVIFIDSILEAGVFFFLFFFWFVCLFACSFIPQKPFPRTPDLTFRQWSEHFYVY